MSDHLGTSSQGTPIPSIRPWCPQLAQALAGELADVRGVRRLWYAVVVVVEAEVGVAVVGLRVVPLPGGDLVHVHPDLVVPQPGGELGEPLLGFLGADAGAVAGATLV